MRTTWRGVAHTMVFMLAGCVGSAPSAQNGRCTRDSDCAAGTACADDGVCVRETQDAAVFVDGASAPDALSPIDVSFPTDAPRSPEDVDMATGGGLLTPPGVALGGALPSRPTSSVRLDCPWTCQLISTCTWSNAHHCAPTSYVMATACMEHRALVARDAPELVAAVRTLTGGGFAGYAGPWPCGANMYFTTLVELARRDGYDVEGAGGGDLALLEAELRQGRPVIVAVSTQLNTGAVMRPSPEGHAMLVTGLDADSVYLNDPGRDPSQPEAVRRGRRFTLESFWDEWSRHGRWYVRFATARSSCADECAATGQQLCRSATTYQSCGQFDGDPCLDLSPTQGCPAGQSCGATGCAGASCAEGASCNPDPCARSEVRCATGRPVCTLVSFAAAGTTCPAGVCDGGGRCGCAAGTTLCAGRCVSTATDVAHCGACGRACASGQSCVAGACVTPAVCSGPRACDSGRPGQCREGTQPCVGGAWGACTALRAPATETCGNGVDEDCNGSADDLCRCARPDLTTLRAPANGEALTSRATVTFRWDRPDCDNRQLHLKIRDVTTGSIVLDDLVDRGATRYDVYLSSSRYVVGHSYRWVVYTSGSDLPGGELAAEFFTFTVR